MRNWLLDLKEIPPEFIDVQHEPMTVRYCRAVDKRKMIIQWGIYLGVRETKSQEVLEVAVWIGNQTSSKKPGMYACFRVFYSKTMTALSAVLFCFYDGAEKSPVITSEEAARIFARNEGFHD